MERSTACSSAKPIQAVPLVGAAALGHILFGDFKLALTTSLLLGSIPGVYIGFPDKVPFGALMNKGLTVKTGQTHVPKYHTKLLQKIEAGEIDPSFVVTHRRPLADAPAMYKTFRDKKDGCIKVVLKPGMNGGLHA